MWKLGKLFAMFRKELLLAWAVLRDPRTPKSAKLAVVLAVLYVVSPIDLVSDFIPILGWLDDGLIAYVLLQVAFHADIAESAYEFTMQDITTAIVHKMLYRHAHIFGNVHCDTPEEVADSWEKLKKAEKGLMSQGSVLADVSKSLPALMRAEKVQKKAAQVGLCYLRTKRTPVLARTALRTQRVKPGWGGGQRIHRRRPVATGQQGHESEQDGRVLHGRPRQRL